MTIKDDIYKEMLELLKKELPIIQKMAVYYRTTRKEVEYKDCMTWMQHHNRVVERAEAYL